MDFQNKQKQGWSTFFENRRPSPTSLWDRPLQQKYPGAVCQSKKRGPSQVFLLKICARTRHHCGTDRCNERLPGAVCLRTNIEDLKGLFVENLRPKALTRFLSFSPLCLPSVLSFFRSFLLFCMHLLRSFLSFFLSFLPCLSDVSKHIWAHIKNTKTTSLRRGSHLAWEASSELPVSIIIREVSGAFHPLRIRDAARVWQQANLTPRTAQRPTLQWRKFVLDSLEDDA